MNQNQQIKRAYWHDYRSPGRYLITLSKSRAVPPLSEIEGDWRLPVGASGSSHTRWSSIGRAIADMIYGMRNIHPALKAEQYVVMPDHVHILLCVQSMLPEHLGFYIARFKNAINVASGSNHIFEYGFNDQIVSNKRNLQALFDYVRSNPYRLAVRRANPDFFTRRNNISIGNHECITYGNMHLLDNPFKDQVIVHRADTYDLLAKRRKEWLYNAVNGGVLVSPFISQAEKAIRAEAESFGGHLILITYETFGDRYKPAAHDFALCAAGRLLIISLALPPKTRLSREICMQMNAVAQVIASRPSSGGDQLSQPGPLHLGRG